MTDTTTDHAALFSETAHRLMGAAIAFADDVRDTFSHEEAGRMYFACGALLMLPHLGPAATAAALRALADGIEAGAPVVN